MARTRFTRPSYGNHTVSARAIHGYTRGLFDDVAVALSRRTDEQQFWSVVKCHSNRKKKITLPTLKCLEDECPT